jgi:GAF domain-containing protein
VWSPTAKLAASNRLRSVIDDETGLRAVSEATAETVLEIMDAKSVSIILLDDRGCRDLVNVGQLAPGEHRFPEDEPYPVGCYPAAHNRLLAGEWYVSIGSGLDLLHQYDELAPVQGIGPVLGVPIMYGGDVWGEIFMLRGTQAAQFTTEDLHVASDLATQFGMGLPQLLESQRI